MTWKLRQTVISQGTPLRLLIMFTPPRRQLINLQVRVLPRWSAGAIMQLQLIRTSCLVRYLMRSIDWGFVMILWWSWVLIMVGDLGSTTTGSNTLIGKQMFEFLCL